MADAFSHAVDSIEVAASGSTWDMRLEAVGCFAALGGDSVAAAELQAIACLDLIDDAEHEHGRLSPSGRAASMRAHHLLSRLLALRGDRRGSERHLDAVNQRVRRWLDPATAKLPRAARPGQSTTSEVEGRRLTLEPLCSYPALWRVRGLLDATECDELIASATPHLIQSGVGGAERLNEAEGSSDGREQCAAEHPRRAAHACAPPSHA